MSTNTTTTIYSHDLLPHSRRRSYLKYLYLQIYPLSWYIFWVTGTPFTHVKTRLKFWGLPWKVAWYVRGFPWKPVGNFCCRNDFKSDLLHPWFIRVTWRFHACNVTDSHVRRDPFTTGWRRRIISPKLQIIFHKRATKYRSLLQKMTYKDKGSHECSAPCSVIYNIFACVAWRQHQCGITHSYVWHDRFVYVTWLTNRECRQPRQHTATHCNTLQHTATHYNTLQHTATHSITLQHTTTHCNTLQHTATNGNTRQHTATNCNTNRKCVAVCCSVLPSVHTATNCNTLQHTATHCTTRTGSVAPTNVPNCARPLDNPILNTIMPVCVNEWMREREHMYVCARETYIIQY